MNPLPLITSLALCVATAGLAGEPAPSASAASEASEWQWLNHVPESGVDWEGASLAEVVAWLGDQARTGAPVHMNIVVQWSALEAAGVDRSEEIFLRLRAVPLGRILSLVLDQFRPPTELGYAVEGNVLRVSIQQLLRNEMIIRTYDVTWAGQQDYDFTGAPEVRMSATERTSGRGGSPGGSGDLFQGGQRDETPARQERLERLLRVIRETVQPSSWAPDGPGSMALVGSTLIVRNSLEVQEKVAGLLARLMK